MGAVKPIRLIVIGASAGGFEAISGLLEELAETVSQPVAVVLHLPEDFQHEISRTFTRMRGRKPVPVEDKTPLKEREVYFAPPGYHLLLEADASHFALSLDDKVHFARPSIDVFFKSVAEACGDSTLAVLLTGANEDGAKGLRCINDCGGVTVVQDPRTAQVPTMPAAALALFRPTVVADLDVLPAEINRLVMERGGGDA